ncbi:MAG TPA: VWA domain-containing protein [Bryobacteraceae bacterium]|jgi:VWFA-related protein|nr:VWA domain-containing protein [Bryobacteraceae bacterium]
MSQRSITEIRLLAILLTFTAAALCRAEETRVQITPRIARKIKADPAAPIRVDVKLTLIPVTVTNPLGAPVSGLAKESFRLFEDSVEQQLKYFSSEDSPVSLGIIFDSSRSMEGKLERSRSAVARFFKAGIPGDEFFLVEFNEAPRILSTFTTDTEGIEKTLASIRAKSWTALFDAVYLATHQMKRARNARKALLVLSDGNDNSSRYTESEVKSLVRESDVCIYSIILVGSGIMKRHVRVLRQLSEQTGGRWAEVEKISDLPDAVDKMNAAIRNRYVLGYFSSNTKSNGLYRKIDVRVQDEPGGPRLTPSWRAGYYAPGGW